MAGTLITFAIGILIGYAVRYIQKRKDNDLGSSSGSYRGEKGRRRE